MPSRAAWPDRWARRHPPKSKYRTCPATSAARERLAHERACRFIHDETVFERPPADRNLAFTRSQKDASDRSGLRRPVPKCSIIFATQIPSLLLVAVSGWELTAAEENIRESTTIPTKPPAVAPGGDACRLHRPSTCDTSVCRVWFSEAFPRLRARPFFGGVWRAFSRRRLR